MEQIIVILTEFLKNQISSHSDDIWQALVFMAPAMVFLTVVTQIIKEPLIKKWHDSSWIIRLAVLVEGIVYMYGHGVFFKTFSHGEKIVLGIFLG